MISMLSKIVAAFSIGVALAAVPAFEAAADKQVSHDSVGTITGRYVPAPHRNYDGHFWPKRVEGGRCVTVQRKSGGGVWTTGYVNDHTNCHWEIQQIWSITYDPKVSDTIAIRLIVTQGISLGSKINLCNTKSECLAMR